MSEELDLEKTLEFALRLERAEKQTGLFTSQTVSVHEMSSKFNPSRKPKTFQPSFTKNKSKPNSIVKNDGQYSKCYRCARTDHKSFECPYLNVRCHNCKKIGHLSKMCKGRGKYKIHQISNDSGEVVREDTIHGRPSLRLGLTDQ